MTRKKLLDYAGLQNFLNKLKGIIPTKTSELQNDSGYITAQGTYDDELSLVSEQAVQNKVVTAAINSKQNSLSSGQLDAANSGVTAAKVQDYDSHLSDTDIHVTQTDKTNWDSKAAGTHTHIASDVSGLSTVATSGSYNDLSNKPTIPTVNNATLTIQKNGTTVKTFTANASSNVTANITVPTAVSELTNDSGYLTSASNLDSSKLTGTIDIARLPKGALERLVTIANQTARFALTTSDVQLGDTVKQLDTGVMYIVTDESKLSSNDGYTEYTAGSATSVPWSGVTGKPSSYTPASHSHGNIANGGTLGTASMALITDGNKKITTSSVTSTELGYLSGVTSAIQTQLNGKAASSHTHTASEVSGLATVATSGSYNDLSNKPTIPTVNNATLTIQKNGTTVKTFTANASSNVTANITVPTKTSDLTNDSHQTITVGTDTTSTASPAHSGTFTCIDSVTRDSNGHVTAVNTKTVTLPSDNNTDTLVTQNVSTANENHPVLLTATKDATSNQGAKTSIFASGVKVNPSTNTVTATTFSGALSGNASSATQFSANKSVTLTGDVTGTASSKAGWSVATTLSDSGVTAGTYGPSADVTGNNNATISVPEITVDSKGRVTSVTNRTLTCKNNKYNVYNKTLTIQKNGTNVATFTSNSNTDVTANITVPTKTSELTNDSGYLTSHQSLSNYVTLNGAQTISGAKTFSGLTKTAGKTEQGSASNLNDALYNVETYCWDTNSTNKPSSSYGILLNLNREGNVHTSASGGWRAQLGVGTDTRLYLRTKANTSGEWSAWKEFLTSHQSLSNYSTLANTVKSLSISGKTITVTPGSGSAYTLTTQDTVYTHPTTTGNRHVPSGGSSGQFLGWNADGSAKWVNNPNTDTLMTQNVSTTNATYPVLLVATADATANQGAKTGIFAKSVKVNPSTNVISASGFSGPLTGNVTGNCSGSSGSCTGNAATATQLTKKSITTANYEMNKSDFTNLGYYAVSTFKSGTTSAPAGNNGDYHLISLNNGGNNFNQFLCMTPRRDSLFYGHFWDGTWQGWREVATVDTDQTITGGKTFSNTTIHQNEIIIFNADITNYKAAPSADTGKALSFWSGDWHYWGGVGHSYYTTGESAINFYLSNWSTEGNQGWWFIQFGVYKDFSNVYFRPGGSGYNNLGDASHTWKGTYSQEFHAYNANAFMAKNGSYTFLIRNDGNYVWFLMSEQNGNEGTWSNARPLTINNATGICDINGNAATATNVTGTVAIANGGTGATSRLNAVKNLTNENVGTGTQYFLTITSNWGKAGYCSVADAKTVLSVPTKTSQLTNDSGFLTSHQSLSNYVTLNGAQTISGAKTFTGDLKFSTTATRGTAPSSNVSARTSYYVDSAGNSIGLIGMYYNTDKSSETRIYAYKTTAATGSNIGHLGIGCDASGNVFTEAPTPATSDNSTKIATTAFVNSFGNSKYALNENFGKGTTIPLFIKADDFPNAPGTSSASIQYNNAVDGTKLYVWYSVCNSSEILDIHPTATKVSTKTGQLWRYLGVTVTASGLGHSGAAPTGILGLFRRES